MTIFAAANLVLVYFIENQQDTINRLINKYLTIR
jgi:hypothetical protein